MSAAITDIEALLEPVPGQSPAGENLQFAGLHDEIRRARHSDDNLKQGDWKCEIKSADWPQVVSLATEALATRTKDLQICAWLVEAMVKLYGFPGLRDGLKLTRGLMEKFWENLYPENDEGDLEARANSLAWIDRQTAIAIKEIPITSNSIGVNYSFLQWENSREFDVPENPDALPTSNRGRIDEIKSRAAAEGKITSEQWRIAERETGRAFYEGIYKIVNECWEEFQALDRVMDQRFDRETPGLGELKKSLEDIRSLIEKIVIEKRVLEPDPESPEETAKTVRETDSDQTRGRPSNNGANGSIQNRLEALRRLTEIADYFRKTEPHSPVSYLVQRAVNWGQMPLEAWLEDVIKDDGVLGHLRDTLGIKRTLDSDSD